MISPRMLGTTRGFEKKNWVETLLTRDIWANFPVHIQWEKINVSFKVDSQHLVGGFNPSEKY